MPDINYNSLTMVLYFSCLFLFFQGYCSTVYLTILFNYVLEHKLCSRTYYFQLLLAMIPYKIKEHVILEKLTVAIATIKLIVVYCIE